MSDEKGPVKVRLLTIDSNAEGQRLDNFLQKHLKGVPKSHIYRVIRKGEVRVNKGRAKPDTKLSEGDIVRIPPVRISEKASVSPSTYWKNILSASVIKQTPEFLFINKPRGLAVHGGSGQQSGLIEQLRFARPEDRALELAHRIDKETSGVVIIARKRSSLRRIQEAWREGVIEKHYMALVMGDYKGPARIEYPLKKHVNQSSGDRRSVVDYDEGKPSCSEVTVCERFGKATLVEVLLVTGRMHQIRCHLAEVGHPLISDEKYGDFERNKTYKNKYGIDRMCLHAKEIAWPDQDWVVSADLPSHFVSALKQLRAQAES